MKLVIANTNFITDEDVLKKYASQLEEDRIAVVYRYKNFEDRKRSLVANLLVKRMCEEQGVEKSFKTNGYGKPYIRGVNDLFFNISHSGEYVAISYGPHEMGVDIQKRRVNKQSVIERFLNSSELEPLSQDIDEYIKSVNRLWAIKESYIKMLGMGLSYDMRNCIVNDRDGIVTDITDNYDSGYFTDFYIEPEYHLSVCCRENSLPDNYEVIKVD